MRAEALCSMKSVHDSMKSTSIPVHQYQILNEMLKRCGYVLSALISMYIKGSKGAKIRNRYNQVPHLTQDTNGKVTNSQ